MKKKKAQRKKKDGKQARGGKKTLRSASLALAIWLRKGDAWL
jgi:hypothetical protein